MKWCREVQLLSDDRTTALVVVVGQTRPDEAIQARLVDNGWPVRHPLTDNEWERAKAIAREGHSSF